LPISCDDNIYEIGGAVDAEADFFVADYHPACARGLRYCRRPSAGCGRQSPSAMSRRPAGHRPFVWFNRLKSCLRRQFSLSPLLEEGRRELSHHVTRGESPHPIFRFA